MRCANNTANLATNIAYKPFGGMTTLTYGNGLAGSISYDNQYRITGIQAGGIMHLNYNLYDANGNIKSIQNALDPSKNRSFDYDALDRLSTATSAGIWGSLGWTYDGVGNRQTEGATSYTYQTNTNKLNTVGGVSFGFDNNGNTTAEGARQFVYNQNQRLIRVVDAGVTKGEYTYNGNGQRVKKTATGVTTIFHYNLSGQIIAESNTAGTITAEYVYLNSQPLAKMEGTDTYYYHNDHLATPQKMTDSSGTVVWSADYKPFGEATVTISTITNNLRFPGQHYDAETGLNYNYYRDYNPVIGRYVEADPIGLLGGINPFVYVENKPTIFIDPFGLVDLDKMVEWLNNNKKKKSTGRCASAVRQGIEAGGGDTSERPRYAKDYADLLEKLGFKPVSKTDYTPKLGDIAVWQDWPGQDPSAGHIQVYNGSDWMAESIQPRFDPNRKAKDYVIYRQP